MLIYTDGAYSQSRNKGGYAFIVANNEDEFIKKYHRSIENATNQRAEILAVISAFRYICNLPEIPNVTIITDSMYVVGTATMNWKISANKDLWTLFFNLYEEIKSKITFKHVRGHKGIPGNELADIYSVISGLSIC